MPDGVINRKEFERTHRCRKIEQEGPGTTYVALARISTHNGPRATIAVEAAFTRQSSLRFWTVYLGVAPEGLNWMDAAEFVIDNGDPMSQRDGEHFFPRLDGTYYR